MDAIAESRRIEQAATSLKAIPVDQLSPEAMRQVRATQEVGLDAIEQIERPALPSVLVPNSKTNSVSSRGVKHLTSIDPARACVEFAVGIEELTHSRLANYNKQAYELRDQIALLSKISNHLQKLPADKASNPLPDDLSKLLGQAKEKGLDLMLDPKGKIAKEELVALKARAKDLIEDLKPKLNEIFTVHISVAMKNLETFHATVRKILDLHKRFLQFISDHSK